MIPTTPQIVPVDADRLGQLTALAARQDILIADARDARHERDRAARDLADARQQHALALAAARAEIDRLRESATAPPPDLEALRREVTTLRTQVARHMALGAAVARVIADVDALRTGYRSDGGLR